MEEYYWNSIEQLTMPTEERPEESRIEKIKQALEEMGLDGDLNPLEKKVLH